MLFRSQYSLIFLILAVSMIIMQRIVAKRLWAPFYDTIAKIESYDLEKSENPDFNDTDVEEFKKLNDIVSDLILNDLRIYKQQKEFIENASHELQTPLAVFQAKLDMLLQDEELTRHQSEVIDFLYKTSSRLTRLNKNLLLLARIDNAQYKEVYEFNFNKFLNS